MGIDVVRVEWDGAVIERIEDEGTQSLLPDPSKAGSVCLRFIDSYGDTVFNYLQIPFLIMELEGALSQISDRVIAAHGRRIIALAQRALPDRQYVKFIGD